MTVTPADPIGTTLATENFTSGIGSWQSQQQPGATVDASTGELILTPPSGAFAQGAVAYWSGQPSVQDSDTTFRYRLDSSAHQNQVFAIRSDGVRASNERPAQGYCVHFRRGDGTVRVFKRVSGVDTTLQTSPFTYPAAGTWMRGRVRAVAGRIQVALWVDGEATPSAWLVDTTDGSPLLVSGKAHVFGLNGNTSALCVTRYDDFAVGDATPPAGGDTTAPSVPAGLTATLTGNGQVTLTWSASTDAVGVTSYRVQRGGVTVASSVAGTSHVDSGLSAGSYTWTVSAVDAAGNRSAESTSAGVTVPATAASSNPIGNILASEDYSAGIGTWRSDAQNGATVAVVDQKLVLTPPSGSFAQGAIAYWSGQPAVVDGEYRFEMTVDTSGSYSPVIAIRSDGGRASNERPWRGYCVVLSRGSSSMSLRRRDGGNPEVTLASASFSPPGAGVPMTGRFRAFAGRLQYKFWPSASAEPTDWQLDATDPDPILVAGKAHVFALNGNDATIRPVRFDNWVLGDGQSTDDTEPPPTVGISGGVRTVNAFEDFTVTATSNQASVAWSTSGPALKLVTDSGLSRTYRAPGLFAGAATTLTATATNVDGDTATASVQVNTLPHSEFADAASTKPVRLSADAALLPSEFEVVPEPDPEPTYSRTFSVVSSTPTTGWDLAVRTVEETITVQTDHIICEAGGFVAGSHFARALRNLPLRDDYYIDCATPAGRFTIRGKFFLPADYYTQSEGFCRWFNTDNYPSVLSGSGETVGAADADEWRVGFGPVSATTKFPVLMSYHENNQDMNLWQGTSQLAAGQMHDVVVDFTPNTPGQTDGAWTLTINGTQVAQATGVQTIPESVMASERKVTTMFGGIDGAYTQNTNRLRVDLYELELTHDEGLFELGVTEPTATNTGPRYSLTQTIAGDFTPSSGTTYERVKFTGRILTNSSMTGVVFRDCHFAGLGARTSDSALVNNELATSTIRYERCLFKPDTPSQYWHGIRGKNYTLDRCRFENVVDGWNVNVGGTVNVKVHGCYIADLAYFSPCSYQNDNRTHNDSGFIFGGSSIEVLGNVLSANASATIGDGGSTTVPAPNPYHPSVTGQALGVNPSAAVNSSPANVTVRGNWFSHGAQSITMVTGAVGIGSGWSITGNRFDTRTNPTIAGERRGVYIASGLSVPGLPPTTGPDTTSGNVDWDGSQVIIHRELT